MIKLNYLNYKVISAIVFALIFLPFLIEIFFGRFAQINFNEIEGFSDFSTAIFLNTIFKNKFIYGDQLIFQLGPLSFVRYFIFDPDIFFNYLFFRFIYLFLTFYIFYVFINSLSINLVLKVIIIYISSLLIIYNQDGIFYFLFFFLVVPIYPKIKEYNYYILIFLIAFNCLIKFSFVVLALYSLICYALINFNTNLQNVIKILFLFFISLITLNYISGFTFPSFVGYFFGNFSFILGYTEGHVLHNKIFETFQLIIIIVLNFLLFYFYIKNLKIKKKIILTFFYVGISYVAYKHAITRHDAHIWHSLVFYLPLTLLLASQLLSHKKSREISRLVPIISISFLSIVLNFLIFDNYNNQNYFKLGKDLVHYVTIQKLFHLKSTIQKSSIYNFDQIQSHYFNSKEIIYNEFKNDFSSYFDIFGDNNSLGFIFEKKYLPRPGIYSFNTYGLENLKINKNHYLNSKLDYTYIPENFEKRVDNRLYLNMDNLVWPLLYENFYLEKTLKIKNKIFLKLKKTSNNDYVYKYHSKIETNLNLWNNLDYCSDINKYCFVKIIGEKSLFGRFVDFVYKPLVFQIVIDSQNSIKETYRITFDNSEHGFLTKPYSKNINDLLTYYNCYQKPKKLNCSKKINNIKIIQPTQFKIFNFDLYHLYFNKIFLEKYYLQF